MDKRYGKAKWGDGGTRVVKKDWSEPPKWNKLAEKAGERHRVFCASLADVCEDREDVSDARARLVLTIQETPHLDWLLLTKRPENFERLFGSLFFGRWPSNVWAGTSCENQATADERIPHLLRVPAAVRFLSCEPLLGPVNLECVNFGTRIKPDLHGVTLKGYAGSTLVNETIDWVIIGGESGPGARPCDIAWVRSLVAQCKAAGVAPFVKQLGARPVDLEGEMGYVPENGDRLKDHKGGDMSEWPEDLRVREMPEVRP